MEGFADDYAFVIQGLLDLYEASFDVSWLQFAIELQETQDRLFLDEERGGYFSSTGQDATILLRMKEDNDSAEPAASSVAALNLLRLAQLRDDPLVKNVSDQLTTLEKLVAFPRGKVPSIEEVRKVNGVVTELMREIQTKTDAR